MDNHHCRLMDERDDEDSPVPLKRSRLHWQHVQEPDEENSNGNNNRVKMDNSSEVVTKIAGIYAERLMSDVLLVVGDQELPAHRLILCASSEVFQVMLMNSIWSESQEKRIVLKESPACATVFEVFLKYLYTGKINVDYANVIPLVQLADKYYVKDLLKVGLDFMSRNVCLAAKRNQVVSWYQFTTNCGYKKVASLCHDFIKWNYAMVSNSIDWSNLESESLVKLLNCSDIVAHDEMVLYNSVQMWLAEQEKTMYKNGEENIDLHMERLTFATMSYVRFPMMSPSQLADLLLSPLTKRYMVFMLDRMSGAMAYHRNQKDAIKNILKWKNGDRLLTPRLYTEDKFCTDLSVDYFPQLPIYHKRGLTFSALESTADYAGDSQVDWMVDFYPKGVWIQKCFAILTQPHSMKEVPDKVLRTVRATISTKEEFDEKRVKIGILVVGDQDGFEHIRHVRTHNYIFSKNDQIVHFDDLLCFDSLNDLKVKSKFLTGGATESLKILVTITPLHRSGSLSIP